MPPAMARDELMKKNSLVFSLSRINTSCGQCLYFSSFQLSVLGRNLLIFSSRPEGYSIWRRLAVSVVYFLLGVRHPMSSAIFFVRANSVRVVCRIYFLLFVCVAVCLFLFLFSARRLHHLSPCDFVDKRRTPPRSRNWMESMCLFYFALLLRQ